jgi:hypothetical protein
LRADPQTDGKDNQNCQRMAAQRINKRCYERHKTFLRNIGDTFENQVTLLRLQAGVDAAASQPRPAFIAF